MEDHKRLDRSWRVLGCQRGERTGDSAGLASQKWMARLARGRLQPAGSCHQLQLVGLGSQSYPPNMPSSRLQPGFSATLHKPAEAGPRSPTPRYQRRQRTPVPALLMPSARGRIRPVRRLRGQRLSTPERLLVVLPSWVGDFVMATPTLGALRRTFPETQITFLARPIMDDLIDGGGWADNVLHWEPKRRGRRHLAMATLAAQLRRQHFDWAVLLTNSFRSALLARLAGITRRIGYDRDGRGLLLTDRLPVSRVNGQIAVTRMVDYYGKLAEHLGCEPPGDTLRLHSNTANDRTIEQRLAGLGIADRRPLVVVCPGASFGASKLWPPERFAALADVLVERHKAAIVVSCAPGEEEIARRIGGLMKQDNHVLDDPVTTLGEFKSLIRRCDLLVNNDTGPRHVAKAFNVPVVTIFGPTHQGWTDTDYPQERKVAVSVDCGPCQKKVCPLDDPAKRHCCMTGVTVEMVAAAADELLTSEG